MLRDRGEISFDLCGFPGGKMKQQGIYTFTPENAVLLRNNPIFAPIKNRGAVATEKLPRPGFIFFGKVKLLNQNQLAFSFLNCGTSLF